MSEPKWLEIARAHHGEREVKGRLDNPIIVAMFADCGWDDEADETAWCAAFVGSCLKRAGYPIPPKTVNLMARSYLRYGQKLAAPTPGCIAVWPRGKPPSGHVNIVVAVNHEAGTVRCIGGNQSDAVTTSTHLMSKAIGWRWPVAATEKALIEAGSKDIKAKRDLTTVATGGGVATGVGMAAKDIVEKLPDPPPVAPSVTESLQQTAEHTSLIQQISEGAHAIGTLVVTHPWIIGLLVTTLGIWWVSRRMVRTRLARAERGDALSSED